MLKPAVDLVSGAVSGDVKSTEALLELAWPEAYRIARFALGSAAAAEDAAQEACAKALVSITKLKDPASFPVWFYRIAVNEAMNVHRKRMRNDAYRELRDSGDVDGPEDRLDVRKAVSTLPVHLRITVLLFYYFDLSAAEIAGLMNITPVAVRLRLMLARRRLRSLLSDSTLSEDRASRKGDARSHEHEPAR